MGVFVLKSGLRILIRAPQVPFLVPPKRPFWVFLAILGVPKRALGVQPGTAMCFLNFHTLVFWTPLMDIP